jgi:hypothetical protein
MSFEDAAAALGDAIEADAGPAPAAPMNTEQAPVVPTTPEGESQPTQVQPEVSALARDEFGRWMARTDEPATEPAADTFDEGKFNPDLLPEELQPGWKQLQAAWTQKTQGLAERQRQLEEQASQFEGIDPTAAREALELYTALQDPSYLVQFHSELSEALQAQGLSQAQADVEAARRMEDASGTQDGAVSDSLSALRSDPELAPVANELTSLKNMIAQMQHEREFERQQQQEVQRQMAIAGEQIRQEAALVEQGFNDKQLKRVHELSGAFGGNLLQTADAFRAIREEAISDFVTQKGAVDVGVGSLGGTASTSVVPVQIESLDQGEAAALEHLRQAGITTLDV